MDIVVKLWRDTGFLDYVGSGTMLALAVFMAYKVVKGVHNLMKDTPWWRANKENFLTEVAGWFVAIVLSSTAILWKNWFDANLYGIGALNGAVALVLRFFAPAVWVAFIWWPWSKQEAPDPTGPMDLISNDAVITALNRGIIASALTSSALASGTVEPGWLGKWWVIVLATSFVCVTVTRIGTTQRPMEVWHKLTKGKYRGLDTPSEEAEVWGKRSTL